jgi:hypothetical protein
MLRRVALVRIDVSEDLSASVLRVTRICELGTTVAVTSNRRTSETSVLTRATRRNIPEDTILHGAFFSIFQSRGLCFYSIVSVLCRPSIPGLLCRPPIPGFFPLVNIGSQDKRTDSVGVSGRSVTAEPWYLR